MRTNSTTNICKSISLPLYTDFVEWERGWLPNLREQCRVLLPRIYSGKWHNVVGIILIIMQLLIPSLCTNKSFGLFNAWQVDIFMIHNEIWRPFGVDVRYGGAFYIEESRVFHCVLTYIGKTKYNNKSISNVKWSERIKLVHMRWDEE